MVTDKQKIFNTTGYYADGRYYHYVKNHLGSICLVIDSETDNVIQNTYYSASGVPSSTNLDMQPYLYNGKEFIEAYGLNEYDSQARMYYAPIMRTTTMDPMAESYYHISPYAWCRNNPIAFIDPDGDVVIHITGRQMQEIVNFAPGEKYEGDDKFIQKIWYQLDVINQTESGNELIRELLDANGDDFNITNKIAHGPDGLSVYLYSPGKREFRLGEEVKDVEFLGHELFHAYQDVRGYGGASCANDVEAYLFQGIIASELKNIPLYLCLPWQIMPVEDSQYKATYNDIVYDGILNANRLDVLVNGFRLYSNAGVMGIADKYTKYSENQQYSILNFWKK